jgi:hypothetical protein
MGEDFKLAGAIVAFAVGAFTIWDRWVRGRPLAWVTAKKFGANAFKCIRIKNPWHGDVFIKGVRALPAGVYGIARDHSNDAILQATAPQLFGRAGLHVLLRRDGEYDLPIFYLPKPVDMAEKNRLVCFLIFWRKTSSSWLPQVPVPVINWTAYIDGIADAVASQPDEGRLGTGAGSRDTGL